MEQYIKPKLEVKNITKTFFSKKGKFEAIEDVSFHVNDGEFLVLLGPGRCGKSVLLNIISGLLEQTSGAVYFNGNEIHGINSEISMVFQKTAIMSFKTVRENVELGLKFAGVDKKKRAETAQHYIDLVGLGGFENSYPTQLSGGMKQRVGIARAYATHPQVLIMDEPFGQLDAQTRYSMQDEILRISGEEKKTIIFVTNNIEEACSLGDRIVLLSSRPAKVKEVYDMNFLPKPRDIVSEEFLSMRQKISDNTDLAL